MKFETEEKLKEELLERFIRYVKIDTRSDPHKEEIPSTPGQWDLLHILEEELKEAGAAEITLDKHGYLIGRFPANLADVDTENSDSGTGAVPVIALMAHVDTAPDLSGKGVEPRIIENYNCGIIPLGESGYSLLPDEYPALLKHEGDTLITTCGTTLLGADDKAGVSEIMSALFYLRDHPDIKHPAIEVVFTPDEETGKGLDKFDPDWLQARCCYTMDGGEEGEIENECFNAAGFEVVFNGKVIHPGTARGKLVSAVSMAGTFLSMLPGNESPEATDGRYGYYAAMEIKGSLDKVTITGIIRDFAQEEIDRRADALKVFASAVESKYPGGEVSLTVKKQYANMLEYINKDPLVMEKLEGALKAAGVTPVKAIIRGGTDGSRLSEMGIPAPNVFTGGHNYHSRFEWASLDTMYKAFKVIVNLLELWAE